MELYGWDVLAAGNNFTPPDGFPENMPYGQVNDSAREIMAVIRRFVTAMNGVNDTAGTQPAYTLVSGLTFSAYAEGMLFGFTAHASSTGNVTLNVDGKGAAAVRDSRGVQLGSGDIVLGSMYLVQRRASDFQVIGALSGSGISNILQLTMRNVLTTGGTSNAYTITTGLSLTALASGMLFAIRPDRNNTGAATLNVDGLGAVALEDAESAALAADDLQNGVAALVWYNGTEFRIISGIPINLTSMVVGALPVANGGTAGTSASAARTNLAVGYASDANIRASASGVVVTPDGMESAAATVALADSGGNIAVDWDAAINFTMTMDGDYTLSNPSNGQPGTWRTILFTQDGTGNQTLAFGNQYVFPGGTEPVLSTAASAVDRLAIFCRTSSVFEVYGIGIGLAA